MFKYRLKYRDKILEGEIEGRAPFKSLEFPDDVVGIKLKNGELADLHTPSGELAEKPDSLIEGKLLTPEDREALEILRHSASHVLAAAVLRLYSDAKPGIGPAIETGFYYDFKFPEPISAEDLEKIENEMGKIVEENQPFERKEVSKEEALELFKNNPFKKELIEGIDGKITIYQNGEFVDLCRGPHVPSTSWVKNFKLLSLAGAYWRGDERNPMLTRIYGTAFFSKEDLEAYLNSIEEAKKRDHRKLGRELDLYSINENSGPGLVLWHPNGAMVRWLLEEFLRKEHYKRGYLPVYTPHIMRLKLWEISGHLENYRENMFFVEPIEGDPYAVKPMNCPAHILIYKSRPRSYRELPIRFFELGTVYRYERSGVLHGLLRVRGFTQDDAHIFTTPEMLTEEIEKVMDFVEYIMKTFGFTYSVYVGTMPEKHLGSEEIWEKATNSLTEALKRRNIDFEVEEKGGAFYGPKIDITLNDSLGREWQSATIQVDFNLPERFDVTYIDRDNSEKRTVMIHRAIFGSIERFFGVLIEHFAGAFPTWLAPVQVKILPVSDKFMDYARKVEEVLREHEIRVFLDQSGDRLGAKIFKAQKEKIPYMLIIGGKEMEAGSISIRTRTGKEIKGVPLGTFIENIKREIENKSLSLIFDR